MEDIRYEIRDILKPDGFSVGTFTPDCPYGKETMFSG